MSSHLIETIGAAFAMSALGLALGGRGGGCDGREEGVLSGGQRGRRQSEACGHSDGGAIGRQDLLSSGGERRITAALAGILEHD